MFYVGFEFSYLDLSVLPNGLFFSDFGPNSDYLRFWSQNGPNWHPKVLPGGLETTSNNAKGLF